jgi:hypothetical protein
MYLKTTTQEQRFLKRLPWEIVIDELLRAMYVILDSDQNGETAMRCNALRCSLYPLESHLRA